MASETLIELDVASVGTACVGTGQCSETGLAPFIYGDGIRPDGTPCIGWAVAGTFSRSE